MMLFPLPTMKCLSLSPGLFTSIYSSTFYLSLEIEENKFDNDPIVAVTYQLVSSQIPARESH
jgi:hypothetical protein